jgi:hypothetical protein
VYPRVLWIAIPHKADELQQLTKRFTFFKVEEGLNDEIKPSDKLDTMTESFFGDVVAACMPCQDKDGQLGVMCVVYSPEDLDASTAAHEAVHITDYFYEVLGMYAEDFSNGDEHYAYLVGWAAGQLVKAIKEYTDGKQ